MLDDIPLLQELKAECLREGERRAAIEIGRKYILSALKARFGIAAQELEPTIQMIELDQIDGLLELAVTCRSLASFRKKLTRLNQ